MRLTVGALLLARLASMLSARPVMTLLLSVLRVADRFISSPRLKGIAWDRLGMPATTTDTYQDLL